jgi:hypothetical protein
MDFHALTSAFKADMVVAAWYDEHVEFNASNLETRGVLVTNTHPIVFVHKDHPSITCLRNSQHLIRENIDDYPLIEGIYLKLSTALFAACCHSIRTQIYSKPYPARPRALVKLQRWARAMLQQRRNRRRLALAMALHAHIGVSSPMHALDAELLALIAAT